mmetsp:Transcript_36420/g.96857  ORF Transcript_36420/g.96857 Transcript_36420/m.96857 type:complete len:276 (-) Transcript_36420:50-877(-)
MSRRWGAALIPSIAALCVGHRQRKTAHAHTVPAASWECLQAYAINQKEEVAAGRGPLRAPEIDQRYRRYFEWTQVRGQSGWDYLVSTAQWRMEHGGPWVALEPNIVAYELDAGIEHWNLWYHPNSLPGNANLDLQVGAEVEVSREDPTRPLRVRINKIRRLDWNAEEMYELAHSSGDQFLAKRWELMPPVSCERWAAVLRHVRIFLPSLSEDEVVIFQNIPELRSVPQVAHAHVFVRPTSEATRSALHQLRLEWRLRSPWAEYERLGGRGSEVGF